MSDSENLTTSELWAAFRTHWLWIAAAPAFALLAGLATIALSHDVYRSEAVLAPVGDEDAGMQLTKLGSQMGNLASLVGIPLPTGSAVATHVATLRSKELIARFVEEKNLLPVLFADDWNADERVWRKNPSPTLEEAVIVMDEEVRSVFEDKESGIVVLRVDWQDPQLAAEWAREIVNRANSVLRTTAIAEAKSSMEYLQRELQKTNVVELQNAIFRLMESQTQKIMIANVRPEYAFRIVDPPRVSDQDDPVWPNAPLILVVAAFAGVALAFLLAAVLARRR
mgnify:CR=1 FL=1